MQPYFDDLKKMKDDLQKKMKDDLKKQNRKTPHKLLRHFLERYKADFQYATLD